MEIAIDFDGTCVTHDFPEVGKEIGADIVLKELIDNGHNLILFTMRSDRVEESHIDDPEIQNVYGNFLSDAIYWFEKNNIPLYGIQRNPTQNWTTSPKAYAQLYIDDAALGCPLKFDPELSDRPFVNWSLVREWLVYYGYIKE
jgi:hypothetical protein